MLTRYFPLLAISALAALALTRHPLQAEQRATEPPPASVDFTRDIQPIFASHCYSCHGPANTTNPLRLDVRVDAMRVADTGAAIVPGNSEQSLIVRRLLGLDGRDRMPKGGAALANAQIALIRAWIDQGARWPESGDRAIASPQPARQPSQHWAYRAATRPVLPSVRAAAWVRTPIDRFVLARLEKEGLAPSAEAPLETLVRRVSLDLIGLPPSPQEADEVIADAQRNGSDAAYARLVDRLLASPHYGERWARPWLDLARYADSHGFEKDLPRVMWKYRDWVIDALNRDMPFDRFTIEQIAGDMLPNATTDQIVASGFHRNAMTNEEGGTDPEESLYEVLVDRVNTTATVWLGTTLGCAQCHNHKYDPFSQKDYYRLMAFFSNGDYEARTFGDGTRFFEPVIDLPTPEQAARRKTIQSEIDRLNEEMRTETPVLERAQAVWEEAMRLEASSQWTVLTPTSLSATGGVDLTLSPDGSVMAAGANPGETIYTIEATPALSRVTAIRLEALPDPLLPQGGPGRDPYGNFQLNGFEVEAGGSNLSISAIRADESVGGANLDTFFPKTLPGDAYAPRGWRIDASRQSTRLPRQIVFTFDRPWTPPASPKLAAHASSESGPASPKLAGRAPSEGGPPLRIRLKHQGAAVGQAVGRFRLSVTSTRSPERVVEIPARLRPIIALAPADRADQQRRDLAAFYRTVAESLQPTRDRVANLQRELRALGIPTALVMRERVSHERPSAYVRRRGSFMDKGEQVYAGVPEGFHPLGDDQMPNRLGLARWIIDARNPLTARVAANRAWEQLLGRGIVETSEDFGTQGAPPSHPELLDWLATELLSSGWRTKALHRLIVMSATYRQSSNVAPALVERDPDNRLLARASRVRLEAEMVRDATLAASGLLSRKIGGASVFPPQPPGIWDIPYSNEKWIPSEGEDRYRRALYVFIRRSATYPSLITFDATSREHSTVRRVRTNTPLQALTTLNDEAFFEAGRALAARVLREIPSPATPEQRAAYGFRLAVTRTPNPDEIARLVTSHRRQLERFRKEPDAAARVIAGHAVRGIATAEQAAWTLVANALLNLDEALTRQ